MFFMLKKIKTTKICNECKIEKPIDDFHYKIKEKGIHQPKCKPCAQLVSRSETYKEYGKTYRSTEKGKIKMKETHLKTQYGISLNEYNLMYKNQHGLCKICDIKLDNSSYSNRPYVDH